MTEASATVTLRKVGASTVATIPKTVMQALDLRPGDTVSLTVRPLKKGGEDADI